MTHLQSELSSALADKIGLTLIHFLWQGLLLAAMLQVILPVCRSAVARHNWALCTLAAMCLAPVVTFLSLGVQGGSAIALDSSSEFQGIHTALRAFVPTSVPVAWASWLVGFWLTGIVVLSLRALGGLFLARRLRQNSLDLSDELLQRCRRLKQRLGMTSPVQFLQTGLVRAPVMVGWLRPAILIPVSAITGLAPQQLDALILHELAHIRRLDAFTNIVLMTAETILFYHPAIWWVSRRIRMEREHCCDDFAVAHCGDAAVYVEALASLTARPAVPAFALPANGGALKYRVARLLNTPSDGRRFSLSAMIGLAFLSLVIGTVAVAQTSTQLNQTNTQVTMRHFKIRVVDENVGKEALHGPKGDDRAQITNPNKSMPTELWLKRESKIDGNALAEAHANTGHDGKPVIEFRLTTTGRDQFAEMTRDNIGRRLAVVVNGTVITAPVVKGPILGGRGEITGDFTKEKASALVAEMMGANNP
jgi:beta-lactamase regulating signal transducer with metallopeptidase domain